MTDSEKAVRVRALLTHDYDDSILLTYLEMAAAEVLNRAYPYDRTVTEVPSEYEWHQIRIAAYFINKMGALGQITHSENGTQRQYESGDVPPSLLRGIAPHVGVFS